MPGDQQQNTRRVQLRTGELVPGILGSNQLGEQILTRSTAPPLDQLVEIGNQLTARGLELGRVASVLGSHLCRRVEGAAGQRRPDMQSGFVLERDAEQLTDNGHRDRVRVMIDDIEIAGTGTLVEQRIGELLDPGLQPLHHTCRERLRHQPTQPSVVRRIDEQKHPLSPSRIARNLVRALQDLAPHPRQ